MKTRISITIEKELNEKLEKHIEKLSLPERAKSWFIYIAIERMIKNNKEVTKEV